MNYFQLYIVGTLLIVTAISVVLALKWKHSLSKMKGMTLAMYLGMNVGLTAGVLLGSYLQGNLYTSTLLSITVGAIAGSLCGICFGVVPWIEGTMSGLMGGMMGAMLGEMVEAEQAGQLANIFLFLTICTLLLFPLFSKTTTPMVETKAWILKPIAVFILIASYIFFGNILNASQLSRTQIHNYSEIAADKKESDLHVMTVEAEDMKYLPSRLTVKMETPVKLILQNNDHIEHDLEVKGNDFQVIYGTAHQHSGQESILHLHANGNTANEITFVPKVKGTYEFFCTISGHKEAGMIGQIIVY